MLVNWQRTSFLPASSLNSWPQFTMRPFYPWLGWILSTWNLNNWWLLVNCTKRSQLLFCKFDLVLFQTKERNSLMIWQNGSNCTSLPKSFYWQALRPKNDWIFKFVDHRSGSYPKIFMMSYSKYFMNWPLQMFLKIFVNGILQMKTISWKIAI